MWVDFLNCSFCQTSVPLFWLMYTKNKLIRSLCSLLACYAFSSGVSTLTFHQNKYLCIYFNPPVLCAWNWVVDWRRKYPKQIQSSMLPNSLKKDGMHLPLPQLDSPTSPLLVCFGKNFFTTGSATEYRRGGGRGGATRFSKPWPYFRPKYMIFQTPFQTWPQKSVPYSRLKRQKPYPISD